jgi:thioesterase domain-containing protein
VSTGYAPTRIVPRTATEMILSEIATQVLGLEGFGITDDLFAASGSSSRADDFASAVEGAFGVRVSDEAVLGDRTVEALARRVATSSGEAVGGMLRVRTGGSLPPLFLMPPLTGLPYANRSIAQRLAPGRAAYCILLPERDGAPCAFSELGALARSCAERIAAVHRQGPLHLAGSSFGGKVAYEVACHLRERGREVGLVAIIDIEAFKRPPATWRAWAECLRFYAEDGAHLIWHDLRAGRLARSLRGAQRRLSGALLSKGPHPDLGEDIVERFGLSGLPPVYADIVRVHWSAMTRHEERPYPGPVALIRARRTNVFDSYSRDLGWSQLARRVDVKMVPGDHSSINEPPSLDILVRHLDESLATADRELASSPRSD